jgi:XRE family transcriptional regulator, regulator of sulfur utilization
MDNLSKDTAIKIGERIKQARQQQGATQAEVAEKAELNANYYARIERGDATATVEALQKVAHALKVKSSDILPF